MRKQRVVTLKTHCPQCGKQYRALACGPSHAFIFWERAGRRSARKPARAKGKP